MEDIMMLFAYAEDEIKDAHKYAEAALKYKGSNSSLADLFYRLSGEELTHYNLISEKLAEAVNEVKRLRADFER